MSQCFSSVSANKSENRTALLSTLFLVSPVDDTSLLVYSPLSASVIICTRNRLRSILTCLKSLSEQTYPIQQLIIVDSSNDRLIKADMFLAHFSKERFPETDLVYIHTKPGLTHQRNEGVKRNRADVVFFFDDDVELTPSYIERLMSVFVECPKYGGGMGQIITDKLTGQRPIDLVRAIFGLTRSRASGRLQPSGFPTYSHGLEKFTDVEILSGGITAYRAEVLTQFSFDEEVGGYAYMEDVDFSYRVSHHYGLFYQPEARIYHHRSPVGRDSIFVTRRMYILNHNRFFFKNVYPRCRWCLVAYLWAIVGLYLVAVIQLDKETLKGYTSAIRCILGKRIEEPNALSN
ncbi:MAG: glycosyltransferase family 2 protein [Anaerolineae bacterium]